eukprot:2835409-Rhodomonas_salina.1
MDRVGNRYIHPGIKYKKPHYWHNFGFQGGDATSYCFQLVVPTPVHSTAAFRTCMLTYLLEA